MSDTPNDPTRIFALDPTTKGFGYAVFETALPPRRLGPRPCLRREGIRAPSPDSRKLLDHYRPDVVVLEDAAAPGSRRRPRVQRLLDRGSRDSARERGLAGAPYRPRLRSSSASPHQTSAPRSIRSQSDSPRPSRSSPRKCRSTARSGRARMSTCATFDALALAVTHVMK